MMNFMDKYDYTNINKILNYSKQFKSELKENYRSKLSEYYNNLIKQGKWAELITFEKYGPIPYDKKLLNLAFNNNKNPPLIDAILKKDEPAIQFLLEQKVDVNVIGENKKSALDHAVDENNLSVVKMLITRGAKIDKKYLTHSAESPCHKIIRNMLLIKNFKEKENNPL